MKESTKSLIRHVLTALGFILAAVGANEWTGLVDILSNNLEGVSAAVATVIGLVTMIGGFFKDRKRLTERTNQ